MTDREEGAGPATTPSAPAWGSSWRLAAVFGVLAFLQGVGEPTEGVVAQPVRSLLVGWGRGAGEVATFSAVLSLPWAIKPLLGALTDFLPIGQFRRRGYLLVSGLAAAAAFSVLAFVPGADGSAASLLAGLLVATLAVTMADVASDALIVDWGRLDGRTGRYQAATWLCLYGSGVLTGTAGGALSARGGARTAFLLGAACGAAVFVVSLVAVRDPPGAATATARERGAGARQLAGTLRRAARSRTVVAAAVFLAVANFNPLTTPLLHLHMTTAMGFGEQFFGDTLSVFALAAMAGAAGYGVFSRRLSMPSLVRASVLLVMTSVLAYGCLVDRRSALAVTVVVGLTWMTATLVQFELAARACPPGASGTVFAALMAVCNLSTALATWLGGLWYEAAGAVWGRPAAFRVLVLAGAAVAASGWLLVPWLPHALLGPPDPGPPEPETGPG